jgi:hypothetical protein
MSTADHSLLFEPALLPHLLSAFQDRVCQVRMAATGALHHLARVTGPEFIQSKVLPRMKELYEESGFYLVRSAVLQAMKVSLLSLPPSLPPSPSYVCYGMTSFVLTTHPPSLPPSLPPSPQSLLMEGETCSSLLQEVLSLVLEATTHKTN